MLHRPDRAELAKFEAEIACIKAKGDEDYPSLEALYARAEALQSRRRLVTFIDPLDICHHHFQLRPVPNSKAVMFCLMGASGFMGERKKDLAKRFFILLHLFLHRRYDRIDLVFIRHPHEAGIVDEYTLSHSREKGGTEVSSALNETIKESKKN